MSAPRLLTTKLNPATPEWTPPTLSTRVDTSSQGAQGTSSSLTRSSSTSSETNALNDGASAPFSPVFQQILNRLPDSGRVHVQRMPPKGARSNIPRQSLSSVSHHSKHSVERSRNDTPSKRQLQLRSSKRSTCLHNQAEARVIHTGPKIDLPVEIWLRIIEMVVFQDIDFVKLSRAPRPDRGFFPHVKNLSLVNRFFHNAANKTRKLIFSISKATDADGFVQKQEEGITTRLLSLLNMNDGIDPLKRALSAASGVEHLVIGSVDLDYEDFTVPALKDLKSMHLNQSQVMEHNWEPDSGSTLDQRRTKLPFTLEKLRVNIDWTGHRRTSAGFFADVLQSTTDTISLKLNTRPSITPVSLPRLSERFGPIERPLPLRHLTLLVAKHDAAVLEDLKPMLRQCRSLTSIYTSLAGRDLKALLMMLPATVRLYRLHLTVAGCHFEDVHTWREEKTDLDGAHCETECDIVKTCPALFQLKHLIVEKRGSKRGQDALLAVCRARRAWLKWTETKRLKKPTPRRRWRGYGFGGFSMSELGLSDSDYYYDSEDEWYYEDSEDEDEEEEDTDDDEEEDADEEEESEEEEESDV